MRVLATDADTWVQLSMLANLPVDALVVKAAGVSGVGRCGSFEPGFARAGDVAEVEVLLRSLGVVGVGGAGRWDGCYPAVG